jgi:hypothetical protein
MTWIETRNPFEDAGPLRAAFDAQRSLYPAEYAVPANPSASGAAGIVASHSLIPQALQYAFAAYGALLDPTLPLERRHHEMIATVVSVTNRCRY